MRAFFFNSLSFRQPARHLRDSRDDRSMEQSVADVIMNFDAAARSSIIIIHPHLNKLFIFVARRLINSYVFCSSYSLYYLQENLANWKILIFNSDETLHSSRERVNRYV